MRRRGLHTLIGCVAAATVAVVGRPGAAHAEEDRIQRLERIILEQQRRITEQDRRLKELEVRRPRSDKPAEAEPSGNAPPATTIQPFLEGTTAMFKAMSEDGLANIRAGARPYYQVQLPDGRNVLVSPAALGTLLAQTPPQPGFETEPERPQTTPPRRPPPPRVVPRRPPPAVARPAPPATTPPATPPAADDSDRARAQKAQDQALLERGAILLRPGTLQIEPGIELSRFGGNNVQISGVSIFDAIIIGFIRVDGLERDLVTGTLRVRYGIVNRVQADMTVPYVYRSDREVLGIGTPTVSERTITGRGIGDLEIGLSGQPVIGRGWIPNVLVRAHARIPTGENPFEIPTVEVGAGGERRLIRSPTGNGFYAVGATVTAVLPIDPVVLFFGGGYTMTLPRSFPGFGRIDPGDSFDFFAGLNFALNERVSFNFSFINQRAFSTRRDGQRVVNTSANDARAIIGTSIGVSRNISVVMNAGIGLTSSAPNFTFFLSVPITFQLFD